jgi:GntR family transcriptional regulator
LTLSKDKPVPLYHQLKEALIEMIENKYSPGDMIPTESELEKMYSVSRMTVRVAINDLVKEGYVSKRQGRGTFVLSPKITHNLISITSWTQQMKDRNLEPKTVEITMTQEAPPPKISKMLQLDQREKVIRLKRVRHANDEPICIMVNYLREKYTPGLLEKGLKGESLYQFLADEYNVYFDKAQETVEAREAYELEADILGINPWSPVLFVTRLSYIKETIPVEVVHLTSRADRYQYEIMLHANDKKD